MTVQLRPHHLLCILTYAGKGYSPAFTANLTVIAGRVAAGEEIVIVEGPDEICAPLLDDPDTHCRDDSVIARDRAATRDIGGLLGCSVRPGTRLVFHKRLLAQLREKFSSGHIRTACLGCEWSDFCSAISAEDYHRAVISPG